MLAAAGHRPVASRTADLVIVNTCGFIDAAKEESIAAVLDAAAAAHRRGARVAAFGCLVARHGAELAEELPEVDVFSGFDRRPLLDALDTIANERRSLSPAVAPRETARLRATHEYVKISDGCDRRCTFCAIPLMRGRYEVEAPQRVIDLAGAALARGAREIVLVGQDTSRYAVAGYGGIARLLGDVSALGPLWVRLLYLQPESVSAALLEALARFAVPYLDVPLQHASQRVLRRMGRRGDARTHLELLALARRHLPDAAVRSTFIAGFPGETEAEFEETLDFIGSAGLAAGGVFEFDAQEGTAAARLPEQVAPEVRVARAAGLSAALAETASGYWSRFVGRRVEVLIERGCATPDGEAVGRIAVQAPDVDGRTYVRGRRSRRGQLVTARVEGVVGFDLVASAVEENVTAAATPRTQDREGDDRDVLPRSPGHDPRVLR